MKVLSSLLAVILFVAGCAGIYSSIVTVTKIRKDIMNEYGALYRAGKISPVLDAKIVKADENYRLAAKQAESVLLAVKAGQATETDAKAQIENVKNMLYVILDILQPYLVKPATYNTQLSHATQL